jgi:hypothetical protein
MKKFLSLMLVTLLLVSLSTSVASALGLPGLPKIPKLPGGGMEIPKDPIDLPKDPIDPPKIDLPPKLPDLNIPKIPKIPTIPLPKDPTDPPKLELPPKLPDLNIPKIPKIPTVPNIPKIPKIPTIPLPKVPPTTPLTPGTPKTSVPKAGKFVTSEGPLFIMYRDDLTKGYEMFTPMDLSVDGEYVFPLISNAMHTVGEVKVTVKKGMVTAHPQMFSGVKLTDGILTFFPDFRAVKTISPTKLKSVDIPFDLPVNVMSRLGVDARVLMYINCPVRYQSNAPSIQPFSLEDPAYLERMYALIDLMD